MQSCIHQPTGVPTSPICIDILKVICVAHWLHTEEIQAGCFLHEKG